MVEPVSLLFSQPKSFKEGARIKAVQFSLGVEPGWSFAAAAGYYLWGMDLWIGGVPLMKVIIGVNIINMLAMWVVR